MRFPRTIRRASTRRPIPWRPLGVVATIAVAILVLPALARVPARLVAACAEWIALAALLELLSILGFVAVFALVFGARLSTRQRLGAGFRAVGAIAVLPAGAFVGTAAGARTVAPGAAARSSLARSTIALTILTNAPGLVVLGGLGLVLWLGWTPGPHAALFTLFPAAVAVAIAGGLWLAGGSSGPRAGPSSAPRRAGRRLISAARECRAGAWEARQLATHANWKLAGAVAYYAFDNAVLWAAFHAYGRAPAISVIVMGYLVGSLGAVLPLPAGLGGVEGGLIGALVLYGVPAAPAAGAVLLYRGISLALPVAFGSLAWGLLPARRLRSRARRSPAARSARTPCADALSASTD